ncbi:beta(1,3)galactosyltransferase EpsH [Limosilactobacillus frumenti DSM 13145]|uniref:Beta(1,3)galactosyltransferase EpsH n=1 Tax=Limosilactobacillus frumenti DSM 13145 TaxID=1423746 RepID=A0A0R1P536_9LACO|nr:glycosyltransferase family 2 protein [Limosilactobacillus frumenti]KRL27193.1 beta(1,3)galactosyltransferase EpsH [Limosilactobacillus frumenti DSM 13145]QFG72654.1 glycosyltransferase family 2 protein [Limosilactobacillus frumenti]
MQIESTPLISVIIGVHNLSPRWMNAIKSLKDQTYTNWQCIICDDGSTDGSYSKLKNLEKEDSRFTVIKNEYNLGLASALNNCIKHADGEYVARMDDDDVSLPTRLEIEVKFLLNNSNYSFVSTSYFIDNGETLIKKDAINTPSINNFLWTSPFLHPATMFRKQDLQKVNGYTEGKITSRAEDYDLYMKLYSNGYYGYNIPKYLYKYYVGKREVYAKSKYKYRIYESIVRFNGFRRLKIPFVRYFPFVLKPLIIGILPKNLVYKVRTRHDEKYNKNRRSI